MPKGVIDLPPAQNAWVSPRCMSSRTGEATPNPVLDISRFLWQTCLLQRRKSQTPIFPYVFGRSFQKFQKSSPKVAKNRVQVDHSFGHLFDYSAIRFENRKSDLEITQCNDGMKPVQIPFGKSRENPWRTGRTLVLLRAWLLNKRRRGASRRGAKNQRN